MKMRLLLAALVLLALLGAPTEAIAAGGTIKGTVRPTSVATEVEVCIVEAQPSETCAYPAADGSYELTGLVLTQHRVEFLPSYRSGYLTQYYDHRSKLAEASIVSLSVASPTRSSVDADLELGGQIEGRVTATGGGSLAGVEVCALGGGNRDPAGCSETDADGKYHLPTLPAGSYSVGFRGSGASAEYAPQFYAGKSFLAEATPIAVAAGSIQSGIDAELEKGAAISGTVTAASSGGPLANISVCLFVAAQAQAEGCSSTDAFGRYAFVGLLSGSYEVGFSLGEAGLDGDAGATTSGGGFLPQYYPGVATRAAAQPISLLAPSRATDVDAGLLAPAPPPPPAPPAAVAVPFVPAPPTIAEPAPHKRARKCKQGFKRQVVKGKARCVRVRHHKRHRKHRSQQHRHSSGAGPHNDQQGSKR